MVTRAVRAGALFLAGCLAMVATGAAAYGGPAVTSVSPLGGTPAGGTSVTIAGTKLAGATAVLFGSTPATAFAVNPDGTVSAVAPAAAPGPVDVRVATEDGLTPGGPGDVYTYATAPYATVDSPALFVYAPGQDVGGAADDQGAPVVAVAVTFTPALFGPGFPVQAGQAVTEQAQVSGGCNATRTWCAASWVASTAGLAGDYNVTAVATNSVGIQGPASIPVLTVVAGTP